MSNWNSICLSNEKQCRKVTLVWFRCREWWEKQFGGLLVIVTFVMYHVSLNTASPRIILHWSCELFCIKFKNHSVSILLILVSKVHNFFRSRLFLMQNVSKLSTLSTHKVWHFAHVHWNLRDTHIATVLLRILHLF